MSPLDLARDEGRTEMFTVLEEWQALGPENQAVVTRFGWKYHEMGDWVRQRHKEFPDVLKMRACAAALALSSSHENSGTADTLTGMLVKAMDCRLRHRGFEL